jgi:pyruvate/2-oxoglutarate dehydrogenase complex dihydrolipoamide acyltransferase (E2) component
MDTDNMGYVVKMPKLGLEMESGVVLEWAVGVDDAVAEGEVIAEVESEKSIGEVEAREDGALRHVYVEEGGEVPPGTPIGIVAAPDAVPVLEDFSIAAMEAKKLWNHMDRDKVTDNRHSIVAGIRDATAALYTWIF